MAYALHNEVLARRLSVGSLANHRVHAANRAEIEHRKMREVVAQLFGSDDLEFSNVMCMAKGIQGHVYHPASAPKGIGRQACIFCGCDDFDF